MILSQYHIFELDTINIYSAHIFTAFLIQTHMLSTEIEIALYCMSDRLYKHIHYTLCCNSMTVTSRTVRDE